MRDLILLLVHVVTTVMREFQPGGVRAVIAESVLTKHQLLILNRPRRRAPNLRILDRLIAGSVRLDSAEAASSFGDRVQAVDMPEFSSRHGAAQVSFAVFTKTEKEAGAEGPDRGFDPGRDRDETAQSIMGKSANRRADQFGSEHVLIRTWFGGFSPHN